MGRRLWIGRSAGLSLVIVGVLFLTYKLHFQQQLQQSVTSLPVIQEFNVLTSDQLVDVINSLDIQMKVTRVYLEQSSLVLDLRIPTTVNKNGIYQDLYTIIQKTIGQITNVDQVIVRLFEDSIVRKTDEKTNLLIMNAKKNAFHEMQQNLDFYHSMDLEQLLNSKFHFNYSDIWKEKYSGE
jgi:hypothetical protein